MHRAGFTSLLLALALAFLLDPAMARESEPTPEARAAWGFDRSDLPPHPDVRFGVLANGLRYALMRNADPASALSVRLRFDVGATVEGEREQGYVHLLEHLIFHGSRNYPPGSLILSLPRDGLRRSSDFNAVTDYRQTVYRLDLARSDARARETALRLMAEIGSHLRLTRSTIDSARRDVLEEIGARDTAQDMLMTAQRRFLLPGTPLARGPVTGTARSLRRIDRSALRRLYDLYCAPGRATLILVGDFDPALAEAEIEAHLSGWQARAADAPAAPLPDIAARAEGATELFVHPEVLTSVTFALVQPLRPDDTVGSREAHFLEQLGHEMLNGRLTAMAAAPDAPFAQPLAAVYGYYSIARVASIDLYAPDRDWRQTLRAGQAALRTAIESGFTQEELDRRLTAVRRALDHAALPPSSSALADAIADAVDRDLVFTAPGDAAASAEWLDQVTLADVNHAFRDLWSRSGWLLFLSHDRPIPEQELKAAIRQ